jgi:hypothetical protein
MSGWGDLGTMLSGGVQSSAENEYLPQLKKNYDTFKALEEAKIERSIAMARDSLPATFARLGYTNGEENIVLANRAPSMTQLGNLQNPNYVNLQNTALQLSGLTGKPQDLGNMAVAQALATNKILKTNSIDDGYQLNPYDEGGEITPTGKVVADIGRIGAVTATEATKQGANNALAGQRNATEAKTRDQQANPEKYKAPKKDKGQKTKDKIYNPKTGKIE